MTPLTYSPNSSKKSAVNSGVNSLLTADSSDEYLDYVNELRIYWQANQPKINYRAREWMEMDAETEAVFSRILSEKKLDRERLILRIKRKLMAQAKMPNQIWKDILVETVRISDGKKLEQINREIRWLRLGLVKVGNNQSLSEDQIQQAREVPIEELVNTKRKNKQWCCPFHEEKTPSFSIYKDNSWHCFGCQAHGSNAIDFVMKKENLGFVEAVKSLIGA